ncbi:MAG: PKD domain-containing protein [Spirochaetaceae bacterium]|nr:MAG: PKD domain-containing protein [Spirochaetaceae bacterium]
MIGNALAGRYARGLAVLAVAFVVSGCLLFVPAPEIEPIEDQTVPVDEELSVSIVAEGHGRELELTYEIDDDGWEAIDGTTFTYTFTAVGEYVVTITASNGLRSAETRFTVTVIDL